MRTFINDDFLLNSPTAIRLYHKHAAQMPIVDYHCHLNPKEIWEDRRFKNLTEIWLAGDHYKWRLMRANGVEEKYITGDADPYEKFLKWAQTVPKCLGNPLYHWSHLELKRYFGIDKLLSPETAPEIWEVCNKKLGESGFSVRELIRSSNVKVLCTTDDPADDLNFHIRLSQDKGFDVRVLPTFRPDRAMNLESNDFVDYIARLSQAAGMTIVSFEDVVAALEKRAEFYKSVGCNISDHGFSTHDFTKGTMEEAGEGFKKALSGHKITRNEADAYKTQLMLALGRIYFKLGFAMQLHVGCIRDNNTRMFNRLGPNTGFDAIGDGFSADSLAALLDSLEKEDKLPRTVAYSLNENDNAKIASVIGCFQSGPIPGKIQLGSAWWFNDHLDGMRNQLKTLGNIGVLTSFIGMLTDSRSFLSYTRHEYFRRILCDLIGSWADKGEVPMDDKLLGSVVEDICFNNVVKYFSLEL